MNRGNSSDMGIFLLKQLARLPFSALYICSDLLFFVIYYMIGYRRKVVIKNLENSFPEKNKQELKLIARKFYRHFCDLTLEVIKLGRMNSKDFETRMKIKNIGLLNSFHEQGKSMVMLTMHYSNWEWSSCIPLYMKHWPLGVYKPLHNKKYDSYINNNRGLMGVEMIPSHLVLRRVIEEQKRNRLFLLWLAGDQTPPEFHKSWFRFLNQDAMFYPGPAVISRRFDLPVVFQKIRKVKRGHYETSFEMLCEHPALMSDTEIMEAYIRKMEETITKEPEYYLWSHRRWKHQRNNDVQPSTIPSTMANSQNA